MEDKKAPNEEPKSKQVGFRCSEAFASRIDSERIRLGMSIQDMITAALEYFWAKDEREYSEWVGLRKVHNVSKFWQTEREEELVKVLFKAAQFFPPEKLELFIKELNLDSEAYRKAATRSGRFSSRFESRFS